MDRKKSEEHVHQTSIPILKSEMGNYLKLCIHRLETLAKASVTSDADKEKIEATIRSLSWFKMQLDNAQNKDGIKMVAMDIRNTYHNEILPLFSKYQQQAKTQSQSNEKAAPQTKRNDVVYPIMGNPVTFARKEKVVTNENVNKPKGPEQRAQRIASLKQLEQMIIYIRNLKIALEQLKTKVDPKRKEDIAKLERKINFYEKRCADLNHKISANKISTEHVNKKLNRLCDRFNNAFDKQKQTLKGHWFNGAYTQFLNEQQSKIDTLKPKFQTPVATIKARP